MNRFPIFVLGLTFTVATRHIADSKTWKSADKRAATRAVQCVQCKNLRWERENIGSYTWTFVLPAQPTDQRKGRGGGGGGGSEKGEAKQGTWGYGEKGGDTGKWRRERLLLVMCTFCTTFSSVVALIFLFLKYKWCSEGPNHLASSPGYNTSHTACFSEQTDPLGSNTAN